MIHRFSALGALLAGGCMAASPPPVRVAPPTASPPFTTRAAASIAPVPDQWWRLFNDAQLDSLVQASLAANADLRVAYANLDAARAAMRQADAARLPQPIIESSMSVDNPSGQPSAANVSASDYDAAATISWDIDLFGRLRSGALAAQADADAQAAAMDGVRVSIAADTVLAYVDLCGATHVGRIAREIVATQERNLKGVQTQYRAGELSPLEVSQAASLLASSRAMLPSFDAARDGARYRLATLQGRPPTDAYIAAIDCAALPRLTAAAPVGDGAALLLRRPDIREAERRLASATAGIGVARAELYPKVNLGGALGLLSGGFAATASPLISWAFPNQAPARAKIAQAQAKERGALASWDVAILRALREVETALAVIQAEAQRNSALTTATNEAALYARRTASRARLGDVSPLLAIDAERTRATAALATAQSDLLIAQSYVALFRALGGGWQDALQPLDPVRPIG
ncbi:transporter [Sphingobium lactosutens]|uniref:efflux transporter outer membrane subunit n=1 Tax=Sphingobium lactosutens TaxID=522773 RepID=UPI0015B9B68C|nr:efflux transporter outer membrane subunit [Sphingobium lactosutens]NWK96441.1 transporter [Sphingobium lactosutens]